MKFDELLRRRQSVRAFQTRPVPLDSVGAVLAAVDAAPSAGDRQAFEVVCVRDPDIRSALAEAALGQEFVAEAPLVLVFFADPTRSGERYGQRGETLYALQDATIACAYAQLRATDLGLGSVWVGAFDEAAVARATGAPESLRPVALLPLGTPAEAPAPTPRRGPEDFARDDRFA